MRKDLPPVGESAKVRRLLARLRLVTVCAEAHCPNQAECFSCGTATFMILGDTCTRGCRFCAVAHGRPAPPRADEPQAIAEAAAELGLHHVVITSVTRDDLADGGAGQFTAAIAAVRSRLPQAAIEVLTPDFLGDCGSIDVVLAARPDVFNHNVETVPRLYEAVRPQAQYHRSLSVLARAARRRGADGAPVTKSGIMLGLGETPQEVASVLADLRQAGVDALTIGQYLAPSPSHAPIERFVTPAEFHALEQAAIDMGFTAVASGPYVRSSYQAEGILRRARR